jgi:hypothetical protein
MNEDIVETKIKEKNLVVKPEKLIHTFLSQENLIFRRNKKIDTEGEIRNNLMFGHDCLAQALDKWKSADYEYVAEKFIIKKIQIRFSSVANLAGIVAAFMFFFMIYKKIPGLDLKVLDITSKFMLIPAFAFVAAFFISLFFYSKPGEKFLIRLRRLFKRSK